MAKCFITGVDVDMKDAYVLDVGAATRALRALHRRAGALDRLLEQLSQKDEVEYFDVRRQALWVRKDRRVVVPTVANALAATYPEAPIFVAWPEFRARGEALATKLRAARKASVQEAAEPSVENASADRAVLEGASHDDPA